MYTLQFSGNITFEDSKKLDNDLILTEYKTDKDTFDMTKETTTKIDDDSDEDTIEQPIAVPTLCERIDHLVLQNPPLSH